MKPEKGLITANVTTKPQGIRVQFKLLLITFPAIRIPMCSI